MLKEKNWPPHFSTQRILLVVIFIFSQIPIANFTSHFILFETKKNDSKPKKLHS